jgi:hypothetical protein
MSLNYGKKGVICIPKQVRKCSHCVKLYSGRSSTNHDVSASMRPFRIPAKELLQSVRGTAHAGRSHNSSCRVTFSIAAILLCPVKREATLQFCVSSVMVWLSDVCVKTHKATLTNVRSEARTLKRVALKNCVC